MMTEIAPQVEVWKKIVDVQQHFNDLELRIRNFALIVTGAFIGLGGYAIKDGGTAALFGVHVSVAGLVVFCSLLPLAAFYLMDRLWYHRLLDGSVAAATPVEARLREMGLTIELGTKISEASPFTLFGKKVRSKHKMDGFYGLIASGIFILSIILAFGVKPATRPTDFRVTTTPSPAEQATAPAPVLLPAPNHNPVTAVKPAQTANTSATNTI